MSTTRLYKWSIYCTTDGQDEYIWQENAPTTCPVNGGHTVNLNRVSKQSYIEASTITDADSPHRIGQRSLLCDSSSANVSVNLLSTSQCKNGIILIKKTSAPNSVIIDADGNDLIDGQSNKILNNLNEISILRSNGSAWITQTQNAKLDDLNNLAHLNGTLEYFDAYSNSVNTFTNSWIDIDLSTERHTSTDFIHPTGNADVTINTTGTFMVTTRVSVRNGDAVVRGDSVAHLVRDTGNGYTEVSGTLSYGYHRETASYNSHGSTCILELNAGDKLKIQVKRAEDVVTPILTLVNGGSSLTIVKL